MSASFLIRTLFTIKGITEDNVVLSTRKLNRKSKNEDLWKSISLENIFPLNLSMHHYILWHNRH